MITLIKKFFNFKKTQNKIFKYYHNLYVKIIILILKKQMINYN